MTEKIKLRFISNPSIASWVVRLFTNSKWSHVDYIFNDGKIYSSLPSTGVDYNKLRHKDVLEVELVVDNKNVIEDFLLSQRGKKYDWKAIFGFPFNRKWNSDEDWFCSELIAAAIECSDGLITEPWHRVTPSDLLSAIKAVEYSRFQDIINGAG